MCLNGGNTLIASLRHFREQDHEFSHDLGSAMGKKSKKRLIASKKRVCSDKILRAILKDLFIQNNWDVLSPSGELKPSLKSIDVELPEFIKARKAQIDLAVAKNDKVIVFEVKSLLFARLRYLLDGFNYKFWHTRYHFSEPSDAWMAFNSLIATYRGMRDLRRLLYDKRQDTVESIGELYREALAFIVDERLSKFKIKILGVIVPWYIDSRELEVLCKCTQSLKEYLQRKHGLKVNLAILVFRITHDNALPIKLCLRIHRSDITLKLINPCVPIDTKKYKIAPCNACKYWKICSTLREDRKS